MPSHTSASCPVASHDKRPVPGHAAIRIKIGSRRPPGRLPSPRIDNEVDPYRAIAGLLPQDLLNSRGEEKVNNPEESRDNKGRYQNDDR